MYSIGYNGVQFSKEIGCQLVQGFMEKLLQFFYDCKSKIPNILDDVFLLMIYALFLNNAILNVK